MKLKEAREKNKTLMLEIEADRKAFVEEKKGET